MRYTNSLRARNDQQRSFQLEGLESRALLSATVLVAADVVGQAHAAAVIAPATGAVSLANSIVSSTLPVSIVAQSTAKSTAIVRVKVTNSGTVATAGTAKGNVVVVLRPAAGGADVVIGSKLAQPLGGLAAGGGNTTVAVPVTVVGTLAAGNYTVVAKVTPTTFAADASNEASGAAFTVRAGFVDLSIDAATTSFAASSKSNSVGKGSITLKNLGNIKAVGKATVAFYATTDGVVNDTSKILGQASATIALDPNKPVAVPVTLTLPDVAAATHYTIVARILSSTLADTVSANNQKIVSAITVGPVPGVLGFIGNSLTMTLLLDSSTNVLPLGFGTTTVQHWRYVDSKGQAGEIFITQNHGKIAAAADAVINFFPDGGLGAGAMSLKGADIARAFAVGTKLTFGTSGTISYSNDSYTNKGKGKVARVN